ncbi:hypothetical protein COCON_G00229230 [Conger conger]|uniref:Uncharacterized protein n=1 Tax=Conger conger TaxID=82655 RepID=A0A9Q1HLX8_CONCO|nr:hypothetical protein COCON_G00229230 [Conger conger]
MNHHALHGAGARVLYGGTPGGAESLISPRSPPCRPWAGDTGLKWQALRPACGRGIAPQRRSVCQPHEGASVRIVPKGNSKAGVRSQRTLPPAAGSSPLGRFGGCSASTGDNELIGLNHE